MLKLGLQAKIYQYWIWGPVSLSDVRLGIAAFKKKEEYGGGFVKLTGYED